MLSRNLMRGVAGIALGVSLYAWGDASNTLTQVSAQNQLPTSTPIKHLVVVYNENVSFDR
jgi:phospholipase C